MLSIALCDDDFHFIHHLHQAVNQWFTGKHGINPYCCSDFTSKWCLHKFKLKQHTK